MARRTRLAPEQRRAQLIELGLQMLTVRTLEELSVDDIAAQAGISRGLLFHYFRSKQDFQRAVARAAAADLLARTAPDPDLGGAAQLRASLRAYVDYVQDNGPSYVALVRGALGADAALREVFEDTRQAMAAWVLDRMVALSLPADPRAELAVRGWVAFCEECAVQSLTAGGSAGGEAERNAIVDLLAAALPALVAAALDPTETERSAYAGLGVPA